MAEEIAGRPDAPDSYKEKGQYEKKDGEGRFFGTAVLSVGRGLATIKSKQRVIENTTTSQNKF